MNSGKGKEKEPARQLLDVEDDETRQDRIGSLLERLNASSGIDSSANQLSGTLPFSFGERASIDPGASNELLARVQAFLPQLEASNTELLQRAQIDPTAVDIESLNPDQEQVIEMRLGLGVFESRNAARPPTSADSADSDESMSSSRSSSTDSDSTSDSDSDSIISDEEEDGEGDRDPIAAVLSRPTKPLPKRARPNIVVLGDAPVASTKSEENGQL